MLLSSLAALALAALAGPPFQQPFTAQQEVSDPGGALTISIAQTWLATASPFARSIASLSPTVLPPNVSGSQQFRAPGRNALTLHLAPAESGGSQPQEPESPRPGGHRLGRADVLSIDVFGMEDLDRKVRVGDDGQIFLPLLGDLQVLGLTVRRQRSSLPENWPKASFKTLRFRSLSKSS